MFEVMDAKPGNRIFIGAGSGGVGTVAIQLAKAHGLYVVTSTSTPNVDWVKKLGADEVIDYKQQEPAEAVLNLDFVFDTMGATGRANCIECLKRMGCSSSSPHHRMMRKPKSERIKRDGFPEQISEIHLLFISFDRLPYVEVSLFSVLVFVHRFLIGRSNVPSSHRVFLSVLQSSHTTH